jgi:hypothetical protein
MPSALAVFRLITNSSALADRSASRPLGCNQRNFQERTLYALVPEAKVHHAAAGDPAGWLCFLSRSASAMNRMPKMIE